MTEQEYISRHKLRTVIAEADLFNMPPRLMDEIANENKKHWYTESHEHGILQAEQVQDVPNHI